MCIKGSYDIERGKPELCEGGGEYMKNISIEVFTFLPVNKEKYN